MENVESLLKETVGELERLLSAKHVMGEPIEKGNAVVIPLVSYGFGFGAGGGSDAKSGDGSGTGGGGGIKPRGAIVIDDTGVHVTPLSNMSGAFEAMAEVATQVLEQQRDKVKSSAAKSTKAKAK